MKAIIFRALVLVTSFAVGMAAAYMVRVPGPVKLPGTRLVEPAFAKPDRTVTVSENGSIQVEVDTDAASGWKMVEFTVTNHNVIPATYWSLSSGDIHPAVKHNGEDVFVYYCSSGSKPYTLAPGASLTFTVPESLFTSNVDTREGKFRAGFSLSYIAGTHGYYWTDDFELRNY